jgi:two-component system LytT family response regulator
MKIKIQIVEDDNNSVFIINTYLAKFNNIEVVGITSDLNTTYNTYISQQPDILLVDVHLGDENIFGFIDLVHTKSKLIFITGDVSFAIKAMKSGGIDYLLKPLQEIEFNIAIEKAIEKIELEKSGNSKNNDQKIAIENLHGLDYVSLQNIVFLKAVTNYTEFHFVDRNTIVASKTLKYFAEKLPTISFVRIHHSYIINLFFLDKIQTTNEPCVIMHNGIKLPISIRKKSDFLAKIHSI